MSFRDLYGNQEQNPTPTTARLKLKREATAETEAEFRLRQGRYLATLEPVELSRQGIIDTLRLLAEQLETEKATHLTISYRIEEVQT